MPSAKGEAGDFAPQKSPLGVAATGHAGSIAAAVGTASGSSTATAEGAVVVSSHVTVDAEVIRAPFSEPGMAERFVADPEFYRNLAGFVASEIRRQADGIQGKGNLEASTKSQLTELADGFQEIATGLTTTNGVLTPQAASVVASLVTKLRTTYVAIMENHPEIIQLTSIGLFAYAFQHFGIADPDLSLLISAAVVKKEKIADIIKAWKHGK
jgi:hypothetical protein